MKTVRIYTTDYCPYCQRAKNLLREENITFEEIDLTQNPGLRESLQAKTGWSTVPMIFIGDDFIGGADKLFEMHASGDFQKKLQ